tara:strand:- start:2708 stop:3940 length:1233 start_codon:yes stop_codon:yes gene_type:complete
MGSFNTTCAISKTPITEGQKVRVFFLVMDVFSMNYSKDRKNLFTNILTGTGCYPWEDFKIIGYPLLGTYEDYNKYAFDNKEMEQLTLEIINKIYIPNEVSEGKNLNDYNKYHDYLNIPKIKNMEKLQEMESSGALRVKTFGGTSIIVKMAIHEDIFQKLILESNYKIKYNEKEKTFVEALNYYKEQLNNNLKVNITSEQEEKYEEYKKTIKEQNYPNNQEKEILYYLSKEMGIKKDLVDSEISREYIYKNDINYHLSENEFKEDILKEWLHTIWTAKWFSQYNFQFLPVITSGQFVDYNDNASMLNKLSNIVSDLDSKFNDDVLSLKKVYEKRQELSLSNMDKKFREWFSNFDKKYTPKGFLDSYQEFKDYIKDNNVSYFEIGENSLIGDFLKKYEILDPDEKGIIYIID